MQDGYERVNPTKPLSVKIRETKVECSPDGEWPKVAIVDSRETEPKKIIISGPGHHDCI